MWKLILYLVVPYCSLAANTTLYQIVRDGDFEHYSRDWSISPVTSWCSAWCLTPEEWVGDIESGENYILVPPHGDLSLIQKYNFTGTNISFDTCKLSFYMRAIKPLDISVIIIWADQTLTLDWLDYTDNNPTTNPDGWYLETMTLKDMSTSLQFRVSTEKNAWFGLDNVVMECYQDQFVGLTLFQMVMIALSVVVLAVAVQQVIRFTRCEVKYTCKKLCCCCRNNSSQFIPLEEVSTLKEEDTENVIDLDEDTEEIK